MASWRDAVLMALLLACLFTTVSGYDRHGSNDDDTCWDGASNRRVKNDDCEHCCIADDCVEADTCRVMTIVLISIFGGGAVIFSVVFAVCHIKRMREEKRNLSTEPVENGVPVQSQVTAEPCV
eukprot:TRINITY_DN1948_c0_g2_i2.p2 TRINITY_DN1948_c0_g2~~TRINITY_DN1948_c0_g2_i2.p2  ORF type:complete len:123 (+),score=12.76 TRINITY_DN1948_c0_g2_i2:56-424(+)